MKAIQRKPDSPRHEPPVWPLPEAHPTLSYLRELLAQRPRALCTDIDGTISETAPTVDAAVLLPGMRELLTELTCTFDLVATISGRGIDDQRRMIGVPEVWHVGHHGYEWEELNPAMGKRETILWPEAAQYLGDIAAALDEIEAELAPRVPGLWMERKGITGGVHWRLASDQERAERICAPVIERVAATHGLRTRGGKLAIELYPPMVTDKGQGLERLIRQHQLQSVIYLGDDISDTDAFRTIRCMREQGEVIGLSVSVIHADSPVELADLADLLVIGSRGVASLLTRVNHN